MGLSRERDVRTTLMAWADSQTPAASADLQRFMGPITAMPAAAPGGHRALRGIARIGLGLKVILATGALAMTSAAAVGITTAVTHGPPVVAPVGAHSSTPGTPTPSAKMSHPASPTSPTKPSKRSAVRQPSPAPERYGSGSGLGTRSDSGPQDGSSKDGSTLSGDDGQSNQNSPDSQISPDNQSGPDPTSPPDDNIGSGSGDSSDDQPNPIDVPAIIDDGLPAAE